MMRKFPYLARLFSKLFYEILPAAAASAIGGMMFNHYARQPAVTPAVTIAAPANPELMQMVRDDHAFLVGYLKQSAEARQQADLAAERNAKKIKAAEQAAALAVREAKAAETRAAETRTLTMPTHVAEKPEPRLAARQPSQSPARLVVAEQPQLRQVASAAPQIQSPAPAAPAERGDENVVMAKLRDVTATVERIPSLIRSGVDWFSDDTPPRPPASLPEQNFVKASM